MFYLVKKQNSANLLFMMTETMNAQQLLEWYLCAGVDETCGEVAFAPAPQGRGLPKVAAAEAPALRQATTGLAQNTGGACQSAQDICAGVSTLEELKAELEKFDGCALKLTAAHTVFGDGNPQAKIMLIGEAPGADEDRIGRPFVGRSGQLLDKMMSAIGLNRDLYYICNILPWRPPGNRTPLDSEIAVCLPFIKRQIDLVDPDYIFILGGSAANALLNMAETISKMRGHWYEYLKSNGKTAQVLASFHPAYLLRTPGQKSKAWADLLRLSKAAGIKSGAEID